MIILEATITWRMEEEGNYQPPFSGMRPSFLVNGDLMACQVDRRDGNGTMERGNTYAVYIQLGYGEVYLDHLHVGMRVQLQVASTIIATGVVEDIAY